MVVKDIDESALYFSAIPIKSRSWYYDYPSRKENPFNPNEIQIASQWTTLQFDTTCTTGPR